MLHPICRSTLATLLAVNLTACTTWKPVPVSPEGLDDARTARITRTDGSEMWIADPEITADRVEGVRVEPCAGEKNIDMCRTRGDAVRVDLSQIRELAVETSTGTVITAVAFVTMMVGSVVYLLWFGQKVDEI